ncbi:hypothetical protein ACFQ51_56355 [Streptomyces kaempferi]
MRSRLAVRAFHANAVEIKASHAVSVSQPGAVAHLVEQAARATTGTAASADSSAPSLASTGSGRQVRQTLVVGGGAAVGSMAVGSALVVLGRRRRSDAAAATDVTAAVPHGTPRASG